MLSKYLNKFEKPIEMTSNNSEIKLFLTWSANCFTSAATGETTFAKTNTKFYVAVVTLRIQYSLRLLQ